MLAVWALDEENSGEKMSDNSKHEIRLFISMFSFILIIRPCKFDVNLWSFSDQFCNCSFKTNLLIYSTSMFVTGVTVPKSRGVLPQWICKWRIHLQLCPWILRHPLWSASRSVHKSSLTYNLTYLYALFIPVHISCECECKRFWWRNNLYALIG